MHQGSRRSASGVKEKCAGGNWNVRQGSRTSASAEYQTFSGSTSPWPSMHFSLTPDALFLDPRRTYPWPWCTFPWPMTHISLTWRTYFSELKKAKKNCKLKIQNYCRPWGQKLLVFNICVHLFVKKSQIVLYSTLDQCEVLFLNILKTYCNTVREKAFFTLFCTLLHLVFKNFTLMRISFLNNLRFFTYKCTHIFKTGNWPQGLQNTRT